MSSDSTAISNANTEQTGAIDFTDRVVLVTGAGAGLGRSHALEFARRGATVVVNDLGGGLHGDGQSQSAADKVVDEIVAAGGKAVANYHSVEEGDWIVAQCQEQFGRIDVVVNNAGIIRDKSFAKMSEDDWDLIYRVHLYGTYKVTHAAWPLMREQGFGRIVNTASPSGVYGNFGQANYAAAKLGIYGLTRTLALEGAKYDIRLNAIAPYAASRMSASVNDSEEELTVLKPALVTPLVIRLCADHSTETGSLFEVGGGVIAKLRWQQSEGGAFPVDQPLTAEDVDAAWESICSFANPAHIDTLQDAIARITRHAGIGE